MEIAGRQDRISKLGDATLGCILSYLPAKEAARAAVLSSRWRHAFCGVHAISLEEPEDPISPDYDEEDTRSGSPCSHCDHDGTPRLASTVTAALLARNRRPDAPPPPLRALRVALYCYSREDASAVDHWVSYALSHAASPPAGLELVLRLDREPLCSRPYGLHVRMSKAAHVRFDGPSPDMEYTQRSIVDIFSITVEKVQPSRKRHRPSSSSSSDESDSEEDARPHRMPRRRTSSSESSSGSTASHSAAVPTASMSADRRRRMADSEESSDSSDDTSSEESDCHSKPQQVESLADSHEHRSPSPPLGEDDDVVSDEPDPTPPRSPCEQSPQGYTVPRMLFSYAALRSLSIGPCSLSPPAVISLPYLEELLLFRVSDAEGEVQRLIAACPRLEGLTLEACVTVTQLSLLGNRRLCRLALRCCHFLANVTVDDALHSLEYRGAVPETSLVTIQGGVSGLVSCKVDICGEEVSTADELAKLRDLLQQLASTKHLHLQSPRLGAGVDHEALARFPAYPCLLHLELTGRLPHGDDGVAAVTAVSRILRHAPILKVITLVFHTAPGHDDESARGSGYPNPLCKKAELLDAHQLRYNEHEVLAAPAMTIPCLTNRVREINLVHYHGGRAQRTLAKFLLCNAPVLEKLYCGFARGPLWVQTKLKDEMQGWAMNKPEHNIFA